MSFSVISVQGESRESVKNSVFIGIAAYVENEETFKILHETLKKRFFDSSHICWAWRELTDDGQVYTRFSDDGEPSGSAGKPILNYLAGAQLIKSAVFVIRYFGGTRLGMGGLVKAYGSAAKLAITNAEHTVFRILKQHSLTMTYASLSHCERILQKYGAQIVHREFTDKVLLVIEVNASESESILSEGDRLWTRV